MISEAELQQALQQGAKLDRLYDEVIALQSAENSDVDRRLFSMQGAVRFIQGQLTVQNIVFNVPKAHSIEVTRLVLTPQVRWYASAPATQGPTDRVFRPTYWAWDSFGGRQYVVQTQTVDCSIDLAYSDPTGKSTALQSAAFLSKNCMSGQAPIGKAAGLMTNQMYCTPSAARFYPSFEMAAGSALNVRISPFFSGEAVATYAGGPAALEFQILGILEGFKRVRK